MGRYTHRVALSNDRLVKMEDGEVIFITVCTCIGTTS
ncbi:MAG: transposase [Acidobacteriota bacterium]|nr:transposase [Acidobacteriota bacterium]